MKKIIFTTILLTTILLVNTNAQRISSEIYNKKVIHEDFNESGSFFPIITTTDNYFILDKYADKDRLIFNQSVELRSNWKK